MEVFLETERLVPRRFTAADLDHLVALDADPAVVRYVTGGKPTPCAEIERDVLPAFLAYYERFAGYGFWAAIEKSTGAFLGRFHLRPAPGGPPDEPALGDRLRRSARGQGYATEASRAPIREGFAELGARRVVAETVAVHAAPRRVREQAGLRLVRTFHQDWPHPIPGDEHGDVECAPSRTDRERQEAAERARHPAADRPGEPEAADARRRAISPD